MNLRGGGAPENNAPSGFWVYYAQNKPKFDNCDPKRCNIISKSFLSRENAFTLAEVLITLGIIGIVAAMTLPALINKSEKMILKNQFKKSYSTLTQALLNAENEYGATPFCYYSSGNISASGSLGGIQGGSAYQASECVAFKKVFLKNLKINQTCKDNAYPKGCIPKYKGFDTIAVENNPDLSEEDALAIVRGQPGFKEQLYYMKDLRMCLRMVQL